MLFFCLFQCFAEKEYQTESKRNETFARVIFGTEAIHGSWSASQGSFKEATRKGVRPPPWARPPPSWALRCSTDVLLPPIYIHVPPKHPGAPRKPNSTTATFYTREIPSRGLFRSSTGGGIDHGGPLHQLHGLSGDV